MGFHGWDEIVPKGAIYILVAFFFLGLFFFILFFPSSLFLYVGHPFLFSFWATPDPILYFGNFYLPLQPTYYLSSHQPIYLPPFCLPPSFYFFVPHSFFSTHIVATLILGLRPKQGVARLWAKRKTWESHHMLPGVPKSVRE